MENSLALSSSIRRTVGSRLQGTLRSIVELEGVGLHTGTQVRMRLIPAAEGSGISFSVRGGDPIPARLGSVVATQRNTTLGDGKSEVYTVEHLMAALWALRVDNVFVELDGPEPPAMDGSSLPFMEAMERVGVVQQSESAQEIVVESPVWVREGSVTLVALPCEDFRVSYTLYYPEVAAIRSQFLELAVDCGRFRQELASCRTFARYEEVQALQEAGLIKGGSLDNAVVIDGDKILNEGGLRFSDEMVRHKMLDLVGDLSLLGADLRAHVVAVGSGHRTNIALGRAIDDE